ncbi:MAG TPA: NAD(P)/FAD-dependent oxidoreductase [Syntrophomonadaceae bacterium]|nr:NAD(P)/FAD-dependent oxidoreductase [Syntrophomonadaceae bacterium]
MPQQRICVIGGGPAGLAAALEGARLGLKVDLLERNRIGANIRCAEGFYDSLRLLGKPRAGLRFKVQEAVLKVQREYKVDCRKIDLWMIDRSEWQRSLADQAWEAGARILENMRVTVDTLRDLQREYDWIIDSSGVPSVTSLLYGFRDYYRRYGAVTAQYVVEGDFSKLGERLKFVLFPYYAGYYWIFPKGRDATGRETANVGIGYFPSKRGREKRGDILWEELNNVLEREKIEGKIIRRLGGLAPVKLREQLRYGNILLVGDAAGCASPLHGGGIDTAYVTGQLAARWIASSREYDFSHEVWRLLRRKLEVEERLCRLWERLDADTLDHFAGLIARDYRSIGIGWFATHIRMLLGNLGTGIRFRSGLLKGKW